MQSHQQYPPLQQPKPVRPQTLSSAAVFNTVHYGPYAQHTVCPHCGLEVVTKVEAKTSLRTHLFAMLLCALCIPIMWVPYCCDTCKNKNHYCANCNTYLGTYN